MTAWTCAMELDAARDVTAGSAAALCDAVRQGADLRIYTEFRHNEHIEPGADNDEIVREVSDFRVTYLVDDRWAAGIMNLRMPISPPDGFGPRPSMSFFMYNQDGTQAIARPFLDGQATTGSPGRGTLDDHSDMPRYHQHDAWDTATNAPSSNFTYDFEVFRYFVRNEWREALAHDADGNVTRGSLDELTAAFSQGAEIKVGIRNLCRELNDERGDAVEHEVFVHTGPGYFSTNRRLFCAGSQPLVRVRAAVPMRYTSKAWDFGWLMPRTDGLVAMWLCDPYTLQFRKTESRFAIRWFVR